MNTWVWRTRDGEYWTAVQSGSCRKKRSAIAKGERTRVSTFDSRDFDLKCCTMFCGLRPTSKSAMDK